MPLGGVYDLAISTLSVTSDEYASFLTNPFVAERLLDDGVALLIVHDASHELPPPGSWPVVVAAVGPRLGSPGPSAADLVVSEAELDRVSSIVADHPIAATSLAVLLRSIPALSVDAGLAAESAVYSTLQSGAEYREWRADREPVAATSEGPTVAVERDGDTLRVVLDRPDRHNAISRRLRDELCAALAPAVVDDSIRAIHLSGRGQSFCSGGDLREFGLRSDPAIAHRARLAQSPARLLARLSERTTVRIHGSTLGGGIELAAFCRDVVAHPDTRIGLPEVALGLIPGAGGTVSLSGRIGRQRVAALALAVETIDSGTALEWGLVDRVSP